LEAKVRHRLKQQDPSESGRRLTIRSPLIEFLIEDKQPMSYPNERQWIFVAFMAR
jgi:hypothetical protein